MHQLNEDYKNVVQLVQQLVKELHTFLGDNQLLGKPSSAYLLDSFAGLEALLGNPLVCEEFDNFQIVVHNSVDRLGLGNEVISMTESGMTPVAIVEHYNSRGLTLLNKHVVEYLKEYKGADVVSRIEKSNRSVFDTQSQLQTIFDTLQSKLAKLEYADEERLAKARVVKEQLELDYMKEIRQTLKDAETLASAMMNLEMTKKFNTIVLDTVNKKAGPAVFNEIVVELKKQRLLFGM